MGAEKVGNFIYFCQNPNYVYLAELATACSYPIYFGEKVMIEVIDFEESEIREMKAAYEKMKRGIVHYEKMTDLVANRRHTFYSSHIQAGFTRDEAFSILTTCVENGTM